jgi:hypothetical protein
MKRLLMALGVTLALFLLFFAGLAVQDAAMTLAALCLWTPAAWWLGYTFAKAGGRVRSPVNLSSPAPTRTSSEFQ